jgi:Zn finger protein HypA/HybF involved in hydrogenase expression
MKITFKLVDDQHINIMSGDKKIGIIFSPSGTGEVYSNAIQVCGFEEAFDLWGCGIFGEEVESQYMYSPEQISRLRELGKTAFDGKFWSDLADKGYELKKSTVMKRDIQLRFTDYTNVGFPKFGSIKCWECFNNPCNCDKKKVYSSRLLNLDEVRKDIVEDKRLKVEQMNNPNMYCPSCNSTDIRYFTNEEFLKNSQVGNTQNSICNRCKQQFLRV